MCKLISTQLYLNHCQYCVNSQDCLDNEDYLCCDVWNIDMYGEPETDSVT